MDIDLSVLRLMERDPVEGFGWTATQATSLYANYLMFVYASPLIGGLIISFIMELVVYPTYPAPPPDNLPRPPQGRWGHLAQPASRGRSPSQAQPTSGTATPHWP